MGLFDSLSGGLSDLGNFVSSNPLAASAVALSPVMAASTGTNLFNSYMSWKNYQLQKDKYQYDQNVQQTTWNREDTAVQRRANDLISAGMSPVLAAGNGAASGAVVSTTAPHMDKIDDVGQNVLNLITMANNIATSKTQQDLNNANANRLNWDTSWYSKRDMPTNMSELGKNAGFLTGAVENLSKKVRENSSPEVNKAYDNRTLKQKLFNSKPQTVWDPKKNQWVLPDQWGK